VYELVAQWESSRGLKIDAILLAGDVGLFPDLNLIDSATRKHAKDDPTELMASMYVQGRMEATHQTYFCRGNHEDHAFLLGRRNKPVDPLGKITYLAGSDVHNVGSDEHPVRILTIGGIQPPWDNPLDLSAGGGRNTDKYFEPRELLVAKRLAPGCADILLTHDGPFGYCLTRDPNAGAQVLVDVMERLQPRFHFFGHYNHPPRPIRVGRTWIVPMSQENVVCVPKRDGGMGILNTETWQFDFVLNLHDPKPPREPWATLKS
jgi:Icc-related predicted phosphoesterase